ncbi:LacI family transcriptional regulator [Glutamicibacter sp. MNS18]|uniref:LacI family DNA-binding transcriptional regulator n=1 Tax=Glutamicibacter sp. MNS18 TaxID=2989817 RepID=UPI0022368DD8|nr:LacI family DNA-binding transcriptional regulator [Glutamicibacter sp. MNS18]MCW4466366.1 LacI family transcriptional regulator [Glutamicibacter sp. MNS18]
MKSVTMEDVARAAGVSRALVSLAYRNAPGVSVKTRERIFRTGRELNYQPNRIAASLASKSQTSIGVFLSDLHNDLFADIFDGLRQGLGDESRHLVLAVGSIDGQRDNAALDTLVQSRVDLIVAAGLLLADHDLATYTSTTPLVSTARVVPGADNVFTNNLSGARQATEHLIGLGHQRIVFLANPRSDGYLERGMGYRQAMGEAGLETWEIASSYARHEAEADIGAVLRSSHRPTAVFAHNDRSALGVLDAARHYGLSVPEDLSVVGYDNSSASRLPGLELTTVDIHARQLGELSAHAALTRLAEPTDALQSISIDPTLLVRGTSSHPATGRK